MDERQVRITEDLAGLFRGELRCDSLTTAMYACDASLYQIEPIGVAFPRDREDVEVLAKYALSTHLQLIPRGAGTGVAGSAIGHGLIVDFSRHMRSIEQIGEDTVRVQPGVVLERLNHELREEGRYFAPDPSNVNVTTIGGMLGVDAAGSHSLRVGSTRHHVQSLELVLAGGERFEARREWLAFRRAGDYFEPEVGEASVRKRLIVSRLAKLLTDHKQLIRDRQPTGVRNSCGYYLRSVLDEERLNLPRLLVGSEGTLGLFTAATLHTSELPAYRGVVLLLFGELSAAVRAVQVIVPQQPSACDLMDRRVLSLACERNSAFRALVSPAAEAALLVEQTGYNDRQVRDRLRMVVEAVRGVEPTVSVAADAYTPDDADFLWSLPNSIVSLLTRLTGQTRPLPFVEDIAVPSEALDDFLVQAQRVFQKHDVTATLYAHAGAGQLHLRPFLPPPTPHNVDAMESLAADLYDVVFKMGGSISGEHGDGLSRTRFVRNQYGPLYSVFQQIKEIFDPHNLMNPGKIVGQDQPLIRDHLRPVVITAEETSAIVPNVIELKLKWNSREFAETTQLCNGCGSCRTQSDESRMCPFFRQAPNEESSPRAKANVGRGFLTGVLDIDELSSVEMKRLADLCFNCKQCHLDCPSQVDIPALMIEAKAQFVAANGLGGTDWILSRGHSFGRLGSTTSLAANWVLANPAARWVIEKLFGIARERKLPQFARRPFVQSARKYWRRPKPGKKDRRKTIVYFVDHFANFHDTELADAFVAILAHNQIPVHVPQNQTASGMAMISAGDLDAAREMAESNVRELAELAREGHPIVCTEPAAALCLKEEYPKLLDHPDVEVVASQVMDAGVFLSELNDKEHLRTDFAPLNLRAGYHLPCHQKALTLESPLANLLTLIPEFDVHKIEKGCSGMAGAFGLARDNFQTSLEIGRDLMQRMREPDLHIGVTECSSCKIQMEQGTKIPTLHPLKLLAYAYGLMPKIQQKLAPSNKKLIVT